MGLQVEIQTALKIKTTPVFIGAHANNEKLHYVISKLQRWTGFLIN